jgi:NitT/TauT family transport system ATP-binding protein
VGPSGSGKSTLLRAIMGLQAPSGGRIECSYAASEIGILFQDDALLPWRLARQNVSLGLRLKGVARRDAEAIATSWLDRLGLKGLGDRYPRELSGGQRKRVALAQVLAREPKLLLMDEPFASLDAIVRARVSQDLLRLVESQGISVLLVTHDLEEALALSDSVYLLSHGPRARISAHYPVSLPRPRDVMRARSHPDFAPLLERLWRDLSREVGEIAA